MKTKKFTSLKIDKQLADSILPLINNILTNKDLRFGSKSKKPNELKRMSEDKIIDYIVTARYITWLHKHNDNKSTIHCTKLKQVFSNKRNLIKTDLIDYEAPTNLINNVFSNYISFDTFQRVKCQIVTIPPKSSVNPNNDDKSKLKIKTYWSEYDEKSGAAIYSFKTENKTEIRHINHNDPYTWMNSEQETKQISICKPLEFKSYNYGFNQASKITFNYDYDDNNCLDFKKEIFDEWFEYDSDSFYKKLIKTIDKVLNSKNKLEKEKEDKEEILVSQYVNSKNSENVLKDNNMTHDQINNIINQQKVKQNELHYKKITIMHKYVITPGLTKNTNDFINIRINCIQKGFFKDQFDFNDYYNNHYNYMPELKKILEGKHHEQNRKTKNDFNLC